jgi:dolichol-phosphate mannosyltransferase|tara:strand:+ start:82 stop:786 length:705 start_codon:yes stop_codon:yes gene_type:complete
MKKILIFSATYNESENINLFIETVLEVNNKISLDLLIIDDNSPDKTWELINSYQKNNKNIILIKRQGKEGLDTAHKLAFKYAVENDYDYLVTLDADMSHDPLKIPDFINELENKPFVIGSRYMEGGKNEMKLKRFLLSALGNLIIKFVLSINCSEFTSSFRGFNLKVLKNFDINNVNSKGYSFFMETVYLVNLTGNEIKQIPIQFKDRRKGKSKIPKIELLRTLKNLILLKIKK